MCIPSAEGRLGQYLEGLGVRRRRDALGAGHHDSLRSLENSRCCDRRGLANHDSPANSPSRGDRSKLRRLDAEPPAPSIMTQPTFSARIHISQRRAAEHHRNRQARCLRTSMVAFASGMRGLSRFESDSRATLVLIDGHRMAPYPSATSVSDRSSTSRTSRSIRRANRSAEGWRLGRLWIRRDRGVVNIILKRSFVGKT